KIKRRIILFTLVVIQLTQPVVRIWLVSGIRVLLNEVLKRNDSIVLARFVLHQGNGRVVVRIRVTALYRRTRRRGGICRRCRRCRTALIACCWLCCCSAAVKAIHLQQNLLLALHNLIKLILTLLDLTTKGINIILVIGKLLLELS